MKRAIASWTAVILGVIFLVAGVATAVVVRNQLSDEHIVTTEDACLPNRDVTGPLTAYCMAQVIEKHSREATDGLTYAQLPRDDPRREVAMQASFLRSSLYTSVLAFGVAAMSMAMGLLFVLIGLGMRDVRHLREEEEAPPPTAIDLTAEDAATTPHSVTT
jgi:hypothetical protein